MTCPTSLTINGFTLLKLVVGRLPEVGTLGPVSFVSLIDRP